MMTWKAFGRKRIWSNFTMLSQDLPEGTEEKHENLSQNFLSSGRDLNPVPLEYEAGVLTLRPNVR
jgi:hypothetical protein